MTIESNQFGEQPRFSAGEILWALSVWSVILGLTPIVMFYVLMVN